MAVLAGRLLSVVGYRPDGYVHFPTVVKQEVSPIESTRTPASRSACIMERLRASAPSARALARGRNRQPNPSPRHDKVGCDARLRARALHPLRLSSREL